MVLEFGWAYGPEGNALTGKYFMQVVSSGGSRGMYSDEGRNRFSLNTFLSPFNQTVHLCNAYYLPPFAVQGTHRLAPAELANYAKSYAELLKRLQAGVPLEEINKYEFMNDWLSSTPNQNL